MRRKFCHELSHFNIANFLRRNGLPFYLIDLPGNRDDGRTPPEPCCPQRQARGNGESKQLQPGICGEKVG